MITLYELENQYEEYLNETYGFVSICGNMYEHGTALRRTDEIGFKVGCNEWIDENYVEIDSSYVEKGE